MSGVIQTKEAIEAELDKCEGLPHYSSDYFQGAIDAMMWMLGKTPPPSADINEIP